MGRTGSAKYGVKQTIPPIYSGITIAAATSNHLFPIGFLRIALEEQASILHILTEGIGQ